MRARRRVTYSHLHADANATTGTRTGHRGGLASDSASEVQDTSARNCRSAQDPTGPTAKSDTAPTDTGVPHDELVSHAASEGRNKIDHGDEIEEETDAALGFILTQVSMKRGLQLFGDKGREAVEAELEHA